MNCKDRVERVQNLTTKPKARIKIDDTQAPVALRNTFKLKALKKSVLFRFMLQKSRNVAHLGHKTYRELVRT